MRHYDELNDEIELKYLFSILWKGKVFIVLLSFVSVILASLHLQSAERKYTVEYNLKPVGETKNKSVPSSLGGFASIAGIQLPTNTSNDFKIFKELIASTDVSEIIFDNKKIIKNIFKSEWNESINDFSKPPNSKIQTFVNYAKKLLTGNKELDYIPPNPRRLSIFISNNFVINEDEETGFLSFVSETSNPDLILSLIIEATEASDKIMRQRYIDFSIEPLTFYKRKLRTARSREHREALAELIGQEEQKLMFASQGKHFIAEPYINSKISLYPTSPDTKSTLVLSIVLGLFLGVAIIFMRHAIKKEN